MSSSASPSSHNNSSGTLLSALLLFTLTSLSTALRYSQQHKLITPANKSVSNQKRHHKHQLSFLFPNKNYVWSASLDRSTGIASSIETSTLSLSTSSPPPKEKLQDIATKLFGPYAIFLSKGSLTFGLFKSVPITKESKVIGTSLQDALFGISFLNFGIPRSPSSSYKKGNKEENHAGVDIPIIGGLLAIMPSQKSNNKKEINKKGKEEECGCLRFTLIQPYSASSSSSTSSQLTIQTEIVNGYHPKLAGSSLPIPLVRKILYRSTQSIVHAYVMWRYHGHCATQYLKMCCSDHDIEGNN